MDFFGYDDLVHEIYAAALEPTRWPDVVMQIAGLCRSPRAMLFTPTLAPPQGGFTHAFNMPVAEMELWTKKGIHEDLLFEALVRKGWLKDGMTVTGDELVPRAQLLVSRFYRDLWQPTGIGRVCAGIIFDGANLYLPPVALSVYRSFDDPDFRRDEVEVVRRLIKHLARALGLMFHLSDLGFRVAATTAALERLAAGVLVVNRCGHVVFSNHAAKRLFCRENVVRLRVDGVGGALLELAPSLKKHERAFQDALRGALDPLQAAMRTVPIPGDDGIPACVVHVVPLMEESPFRANQEGAGALVFVYDLESAAEISPDRLMSLYGLTRAEAGVAAEVVRGGPADVMAGRLGVSVNTFNTHLRNVFGKTSTHRQADLLKLLLALAVD